MLLGPVKTKRETTSNTVILPKLQDCEAQQKGRPLWDKCDVSGKKRTTSPEPCAKPSHCIRLLSFFTSKPRPWQDETGPETETQKTLYLYCICCTLASFLPSSFVASPWGSSYARLILHTFPVFPTFFFTAYWLFTTVLLSLWKPTSLFYTFPFVCSG